MPEIRIAKQPNGFSVVCYMISDEDTFAGEASNWARECRGITFDPNGFVASRPLHKFFNVGERPETQAGVIDWSKVSSIMDKRDGSMITPVVDSTKVGGYGVVFKSKKSFESDVALMANERASKNVRQLSAHLIDQKATPIFELTAPEARIVIKYDEFAMVLLHIRDNFTGRYWTRKEVEAVAKDFGVPVVDVYPDASWSSVRNNLETITGIEGYIFQFEDGNMVKAKTKWYLDLHHSVTFRSERAVAEMVLTETVDDFKSYLAQVGDTVSFEKVRVIEHRVVEYIDAIAVETKALFESWNGLERKEAAMRNNKHAYFGLAMKLWDGREPDYKTYFLRNFLKEYFSLDTI